MRNGSIKTIYQKPYIWMLLQFHGDKLTEKQRADAQHWLNDTGHIDKRYLYASLQRLIQFESGADIRRAKNDWNKIR